MTPLTIKRINKLTLDYLERLRQADEMGDTEIAHAEADDALCDLLELLGFADVVAAYRKIPKWYA